MRSQPLLLGKTKNYEWLDLPQRKYVGSLNGSSYNKKNTLPREVAQLMRCLHKIRPGTSKQTYRHSHPTDEYVLIIHILAGIRSYHSIH